MGSGPLDDSATTTDIPPVRSVRKAMTDLDARGHVTFGGRLLEKHGNLDPGDWRDPDHVSDWAGQVAEALRVSAA